MRQTSTREGPAIIAAEQRAECVRRYRECIRSYPFTARGSRQIRRYAEARQDAQIRWPALLAAAEQGEAITDRTLNALLPYADTAPHRQRGVWIAQAPALGGDARRWFERAGWAQPEDWPSIATALIAFVTRCVADPDQLQAACHEFSATVPARGFQSGMLSPILNALRPDAFLVGDGAVRRVVEWLTGARIGPRLVDYPSLNAAALAVVADLAPILAQPDAPALSDGDRFDLFAHWLVAVKRYDFRVPGAWRIGVEDDDRWEDWRHAGHLALPDDGGGERQAHATHEQKRREHTGKSLLNLVAHTMQPGDTIVASQGRQTIRGTGRILGPYYFVPDTPDPHRLPVAWQPGLALRLDRPAWTKPAGKLERRVAEQLPSSADHIANGEANHRASVDATTLLAETPGAYHAEAIALGGVAEATGISEDLLTRWVRAIERKGQAIIYGPPGTGKTFVAERLARALSAPDGCCDLVQFHAAYAYEDFVQGLRPVASLAGAVSYALLPGRLLEFCARGRQCAGRAVLVIDEINRADLARVFGEALTLLEYRERPIPLAGGGTFAIPANVRFIGTMNTADRSVALVDYALRRRFAFLHLPPLDDVLRRYHARTGFRVEGLIATLRRIDRALGDPRLAIGISYFLIPDLADQIADIWRLEIEPLLEEYWFAQPTAVAEFRWDQVKKAILSGR